MAVVVDTSGAKERAPQIVKRLAKLYPGDEKQLCALKHNNAYELLVATILSAQCTDERVNAVMPELLARYPDIRSLARAKQEELEAIIKPTGFYRNKARSLIAMARAVEQEFGGEIPMELDEMVKLPGVGRKTASVVLSVWARKPALPVDTHVARLSKRLGLTRSEDPEKIEQDLRALFPQKEWGKLSLRLILHGRYVCKARRPLCEECVLLDVCPTGSKTAGLAQSVRSSR